MAWKGAAVRFTPVCPPGLGKGPVFRPAMVMTNADIVQMTTVSMKGSSSGTRLSVTGSLVSTVLGAIAAEPAAASLEKVRASGPGSAHR